MNTTVTIKEETLEIARQISKQEGKFLWKIFEDALNFYKKNLENEK